MSRFFDAPASGLSGDCQTIVVQPDRTTVESGWAEQSVA